LVIKDELLKEQSLANAKRIAEFACLVNSNFKELMDCFLSCEYRVAQRAAWAVSQSVEKNPAIVEPYIEMLVDQLSRKDVHNAVIRNSLRILQNLDIPEEFHGKILNACFAFIEDPSAPIAIKAFSLTMLDNLSKHYPEIKHELKLIIEERLDTETPAFKARAKRILGKLTTER
jgi:hypothetical protein